MLDDLAHPEIHGIQAIAIERTGLNDVQELDDVSTTERPPERSLVDGARDVERKRRSAKALALHGGEFVAGIWQAPERSAEQYVDLRYVIDRQPLHIRLPSRLAVAKLLRPLSEADAERIGNPARTAPGPEDVILRVTFDHAA